MEPISLSNRGASDVLVQPAIRVRASVDVLPPVAGPRGGISTEELAGRQLLRLLRWPDMCAVPPQDLNSTARVCALLSNRPMQAYLVPLRLDMPSEQVTLVLSQLVAQGVLGPVGESTATESKPQPPVASATTAKRSVWDKLLRKLLNG